MATSLYDNEGPPPHFEVDEGKLQSLLDMGISRDRASHALAQFDSNVERAITSIFSTVTEENTEPNNFQDSPLAHDASGATAVASSDNPVNAVYDGQRSPRAAAAEQLNNQADDDVAACTPGHAVATSIGIALTTYPGKPSSPPAIPTAVAVPMEASGGGGGGGGGGGAKPSFAATLNDTDSLPPPLPKVGRSMSSESQDLYSRLENIMTTK